MQLQYPPHCPHPRLTQQRACIQMQYLPPAPTSPAKPSKIICTQLQNILPPHHPPPTHTMLQKLTSPKKFHMGAEAAMAPCSK